MLNPDFSGKIQSANLENYILPGDFNSVVDITIGNSFLHHFLNLPLFAKETNKLLFSINPKYKHRIAHRVEDHLLF